MKDLRKFTQCFFFIIHILAPQPRTVLSASTASFGHEKRGHNIFSPSGKSSQIVETRFERNLAEEQRGILREITEAEQFGKQRNYWIYYFYNFWRLPSFVISAVFINCLTRKMVVCSPSVNPYFTRRIFVQVLSPLTPCSAPQLRFLAVKRSFLVFELTYLMI